MSGRNTPRVPEARMFRDIDKRFRDLEQRLSHRERELDRFRLLREEVFARRGVLKSHVDWDQENVGGTEYGVGRLYIERGASELAEVEYRAAAGRNLTDTDTWTTVARSTDDPTNYPDGYYRAQVELLVGSNYNSEMEIRTVTIHGEIEQIHTKSFDPDTDPGFDHFAYGWGAHGSVTSGKYPLYIIGVKVDEDGQSWEYGTPTSNPGSSPSDGSYTSVVNSTVTDVVLAGEFDPEDEFWLIARARGGASGTGDKATKPKGLVYQKLQAPAAPGAFDVDDIPDGSIVSAKLVQSMQRFTTNIVFSPGAVEQTQLSWSSGTIRYSDGTSYAVGSGSVTMSTTGSPNPTYYLYFDPDNDTNDILTTTNYADILDDSGKRLFIGIARAGESANDYCFFVTAAGPVPIINAPIIYAAKLQSLLARIDDLEVEDTLTMAAGGEITNAGGDFTIDDLGFGVQVSTTHAVANSFSVLNGTSEVGYLSGTSVQVQLVSNDELRIEAADDFIIDVSSGNIDLTTDQAIDLTTTFGGTITLDAGAGNVNLVAGEILLDDIGGNLSLVNDGPTAGRLLQGVSADWERYFNETDDRYEEVGRKHAGEYHWQGEDSGGTLRELLKLSPISTNGNAVHTIGLPNSVPGDARFWNSSFSFYTNEGTDELFVKVRYSGGSFVLGKVCDLA